MVISGVITPEANTTVSARIVLNDVNEQIIAVIDEAFGQTSEFSLGGAANALNVSPGEYTARLEVTGPNYCGANTEPVSVSPCAEVPDTPDTPDTTTPTLSPCWIWFWINVGLFAGVGILIFVTLCLIEANVWTAIAAIGSGGTLGAVWAALSTVNIGMIMAGIVLLLLTLASFILWIVFCAFGQMKDIICSVLSLLMTILSGLNAISFIVAVILSIVGVIGCSVGAWIDVAWFSILMSITWFVGQFLGCFPGVFINRIASARKSLL